MGKMLRRRIISFGLVFILIAVVFAGMQMNVGADPDTRTWYVDDVAGSGPGNPPEDYTNIQDAIDAASSGDTIYVFEGTYYENLEIDTMLTLEGENRDTTIINGEGSGTIFRGWLNVKGFTITNSWSGIFLGAGNSIISNCNIRYNNWGIWIDSVMGSGNSNIISDCVISNNDIGILMRTGESIIGGNIIKCNTISENDIGIQFADAHVEPEPMPGPSGNEFYHNNFIRNTQQLSGDEGENAWDDWLYHGNQGRGEGNYWSDYEGLDDGSEPPTSIPAGYEDMVTIANDRIGDTNLPHQGVDYFPLMEPYLHMVFKGGDGTPGNPYQISNVWQLQFMNLDLDANYILVNDIDASVTSTWNDGAGFEPIGTYFNRFTGNLNGNMYKITNLHIYLNPNVIDGYGLFGITGGCEIKNVVLDDYYIEGIHRVGGLVGDNLGSVLNCVSIGNLYGDSFVGGVVGWNHGTILNCYSTGSLGTIDGYGDIKGGLVGENYGSISNSYSTIDIEGEITGGLVGWNHGSISNSYASGDVSGNIYNGGLVSWNAGTILNCYSTGSVTVSWRYGGLVGWNDNKILNCYWDVETSGQLTSAGGIGKNTAEMKTKSTFTDAGWDFAYTWHIEQEVTYPYHRWTITNKPPVANANGPYNTIEGDAIIFDASSSFDLDEDELQYRWDFDNDGSWDTSWSIDPTASNTWYDDHSGTVNVEVSDDEYIVMDTAFVIVTNVAPTADAGIDKLGDEPSTFIFIGSNTDPGTLDRHTYEWDFDYDGVTFEVDTTSNVVTNTWEDDFDGIVALRVTDDDDDWDIDTCSVVINNVPPTVNIDSVDQPTEEFILPGDALAFTGSFTDLGTFDTHTIEWDFDYDTTASGTLTPTHAYIEAGEYMVILTVTDDDGGVGSTSIEIVVESPTEIVEEVIEDLEEIEVPPKAEKEIGKAIKDLNKAIDDFNKDNLEKAIGKIEKAVKNLLKAQKKEAETQDIIDDLVELVKGKVDKALEDAIEYAGEDNPNVVKAQIHYDKALDNLIKEKYDKAIKDFKNAYKEVMKAMD